MGKIIFITGGVRSGKSSYAVELAKKMKKEVIFLATGGAKDEEMKERIKSHIKKRPSSWKTIEEEKNIIPIFSQIKSPHKVIIIDCLTLLISNLLLEHYSEKFIINYIEEIIKIILKSPHTVIIVSNEVGWGVVPESALGRKFRDILGKSNQIMTKYAQRVYLMISGIAIKLKGEQKDAEIK
ncbi:bifunctional adenosylcobinamide kinase/adenosylcobinamide-phosphate guanylyltransferase [Candidatus Aerophobetes bacterium]|nr:bifunctional adenosylcobinamide kinase/adenosylcobinamide-phosphate guanylyltransferase [Candidatus Aerophobetes bacterium]